MSLLKQFADAFGIGMDAASAIVESDNPSDARRLFHLRQIARSLFEPPTSGGAVNVSVAHRAREAQHCVDALRLLRIQALTCWCIHRDATAVHGTQELYRIGPDPQLEERRVFFEECRKSVELILSTPSARATGPFSRAAYLLGSSHACCGRANCHLFLPGETPNQPCRTVQLLNMLTDSDNEQP